MTYFYYKTNTWNSQPQISEDQINLWKHLAEKRTGGSYNYLTDFFKQNTKTSTVLVIQRKILAAKNGMTLQGEKLWKEQKLLLMDQ